MCNIAADKNDLWILILVAKQQHFRQRGAKGVEQVSRMRVGMHAVGKLFYTFYCIAGQLFIVKNEPAGGNIIFRFPCPERHTIQCNANHITIPRCTTAK